MAVLEDDPGLVVRSLCLVVLPQPDAKAVYFHPYSGVLGWIEVRGAAKRFYADSVLVKAASALAEVIVA